MADGGAFGAAAQIGQQLLGSGVLEGSGHSNTNTKGVQTAKTNTAVRGTTINKGTNVDTSNTKGNVSTTGSTTGTTTGTSSNNGKSTSTNNTQNNSTTVGTADKGALNQARDIVSQALDNMNNKSITSSLVNSVLNKASIAFGQGEGGAQRNAGVYNSSTQDLLSGFAKGQATSDAAEAVLNYKTGQQQIATNANQSIIDATKSSTTTGGTSSTGGTTTSDTGSTSGTTAGTSTSDQASTTQGTNTDTTTNIGKSVQDTKGINVQKEAGSSHVHQESQSQQNGLLTNSVICSELLRQGKLSTRAWMIGSIHFNNGGVSNAGKLAYYAWAGPVVRYIKANPTGKIASIFSFLMEGRSKTIAFYYGRQMGKSKENSFSVSDAMCYLTISGITRVSWIFSVMPGIIKDKFSSNKWKEFDEFDRSIP